jgi:phosphoserine phosphatase
MFPPPWPLVTVDIDGTLTRGHGWAAIADRQGRRPEFDRTSARYRAGEIGEDEHLHNLLALAVGARWSDLEPTLAATPKIAGISDGIALLHRGGTRVALLSHNPAYICAWYRRTFGFDDYEGTTGQEVVDGIVGPPSRIRAAKREGLRALAERAHTGTSGVVHVGDGAADAAIFPLVGRGVALNPSRPDVAAAADLVLRTDDFREVAAAIERLTPRR